MRRLTLTVLFVLLISLEACQSYSAGLQQSIARADETAALAALHAIATAERTYGLTSGGEYGTLSQLVDGGFLDVRFAGEKPVRDYVITLNVTPKASGAAEGSYTCNADPDNTRNLVGRHFYIESTSNGIRVNGTQPATAADKLMQ